MQSAAVSDLQHYKQYTTNTYINLHIIKNIYFEVRGLGDSFFIISNQSIRQHFHIFCLCITFHMTKLIEYKCYDALTPEHLFRGVQLTECKSVYF